MKNVFSIILLLVVNSVYGIAQELQCGTVSILDDSKTIARLREIRYMRNRTLDNDTLYFRVQIHIIRNSNHITSLNIDSLEKDFQDLNRYYAPAAVQFYMCNDYNYIDDDQYYNFYITDENYLRTTYNDHYAVNIYFANTAHTSSGSVAGYSYFPTSTHNFIVIANNYVRKMTLIHEVGHFFNLRHTHDHAYGYELVNGSNCETAGDLCCDTPADPELSYTNVNTSCQYTGTATDTNGDLYAPDPHNIMSYARKECRDLFTTDQYERIRDAAFLPNRQSLCNHRTFLENDSIMSDTTITNDIVIVKNYYMNADTIHINACHEIILNQSVVLQRGIVLQTKN